MFLGLANPKAHERLGLQRHYPNLFLKVYTKRLPAGRTYCRRQAGHHRLAGDLKPNSHSHPHIHCLITGRGTEDAGQWIT